MHLETDEFVVLYDGARTAEAKLLAEVEKAGFQAEVVREAAAVRATTGGDRLPNHPLLRDALARAREQHKPIVIDFYAEWCEPCKRMLRETFPDPQVRPLLEQCILLKIDTDEHAQLAQQMGVVGLPDIRLLLPDGRLVKQFVDFQDAERFAAALGDLLQQAAASEAGAAADRAAGEWRQRRERAVIYRADRFCHRRTNCS